MQRFYNLILVCMLGLCLSITTSAQTIVNIEGSDDPLVLVDIFPVIMGDTLADGSRTDASTIYTLDNGAVYVTSGTITNDSSWVLHVRAADIEDIATKPVLTRLPNDSGNYPNVFHPGGDMTLRNLHIISGEKGPGENHDWGKIRMFGENSTVRVDDCRIEKDRGGFLQLRANGVKCYVNNCHFMNGGNRFIREGNGRGIDSRNFSFDTLVVRNTVIHNIVDRIFRSLGNVIPNNYIEFDNNTIFNVGGRHGSFVFEKVITAKITNNLLINPMMLGDADINADEQNNLENADSASAEFDPSMHIFTVDTLYENTQFIISNNNLFWTQDVIDVWAKHDQVTKPELFDILVAQSMGEDTANAVFEDVIELNSVPGNMTQYIDDHWANIEAEDMADIIVEDITRAGTPFDNGYLFDFATFDPCYDISGASGTGASDGGPVGVRTFCGIMTAVLDEEINNELGLQVAPNPLKTFANFNFELQSAGDVNLAIYDLTGKQVQTVIRGELSSGQHNIEWRDANAISPGFYLARLVTNEGQMALKISIH